ncbi:3-deoxy-manno-octulosonate cytidylyltransferase [Hydrogenovibrio sp. JE_KL2]|nr:3-deoxy-manno-octulosonate cytidylyltransferase [Hydrogenovibrio sp. JE_KL2]
MSMEFIVVIPARYESSRLHGKPLMDILGKPMIQWTWQQAKLSGADRIVIATESEAVKQACEAFGAEVCLTAATHQSGTERIAEVVEKLGFSDDDIIVNVQGDEPMLPPELIVQVADGLSTHESVQMATLCEPIDDVETVFDPHAVKVIRNQKNFALNFTRAPMPWSRDTFSNEPPTLPDNWGYKRHIGLYAYRAGFVKRYVAWPECALEHVERLEQLRVLWHGEAILVLDALGDAGIGVDTQKDLDKVRRLMSEKA